MYLKSIEVYGFKSFANKIIFEFKDGITGIVGPNGSGKSNVADAVRWVLGEQSAKQLRGSKMEDVIFSGTENRKPVSAAYVAITFDNKDKRLPVDYEEVTVARRVYRSGESEYILNGTNCRRKDIVELFMDTGIGKEGYSIIGQGQIEKILSGKPEDRRELFDEAAGIVKYKKNKEATQKALEQERQNLERVTDILRELEKQIGPLSRQSETAKNYLSLRDQLREKEARHFVLWNGQLAKALEELSKKLSIVKEDLAEKNSQYDKTREEYEQIEAKIEALEQSVNDAIQEIHGCVLAKEKAEGQIQVLEEQIHTAKVNEEHKKSNEERLLATMREKEQEEESLLMEQEGILLEEETLRDQRAEEEKALLLIQERMKDVKDLLLEHQMKVQSLLGEEAGKKVSMNRYEVMEEQLHYRSSQIMKKNLEAVSQIDILKEDLDICQEDAQQTEADLTLAQKELTQCEEQKRQYGDRERKLRETHQRANEQFQRDRSKLETLRNMAERYDGYGNSIKKVMEQKKHYPGIVGVVADIIHVKKEHETAIETALGGSIQNIVTDTEHTAKAMIEYLKKNRFGRATFLPLNAIKGSDFKRREVLKEKGVIGIADELIEVKPEYRNLISHLVGRILVMDTIDSALQVARKYGYSFRIVTLEGESLSPGGAMTGGAFRNSSNLLGRQREMEDLTASVAQLKENIVSTREELEKIKSLSGEVIKKEQESREKYQELLLAKNQLVMEQEKISEQIEEQERIIASLNREKQDIQLQLTEIEKNKEEIRQTQEALASVQDEMGIQEEELNQKLLEAQKEENAAQEAMMQMQMKLTALEQKKLFFQENKERIQAEMERARAEYAKEQRDSYEMKEKQQELRGEIEKLRQEILHYEKVKQEREVAKEKEMQQKEAYLQQNKSFFAKREELSKEINGLDKEEYRLSGRLSKGEQEIEDLKLYMWETYEMTLSGAKDYFKEEEEISFADLKSMISDLKKKINALGPVNVHAIEDYKETLERYEFLKGQYTDIQVAEGKLLDIIKELDEAMKKQFQEKFKEINEMFQIVFAELFGGGKGTLELMEEDNLLETGIRITAQPPGKKLQNMMQMSGGEKSLTAIALLFAIQNLKPSPFCLLDEIEAALDDSNVDRFAGYLKKLTKDTQFIVITHRRGTMTAADMLYGITMQEKGVSTLISVDLIEKEL